jgi:hypothetical protein
MLSRCGTFVSGCRVTPSTQGGGAVKLCKPRVRGGDRRRQADGGSVRICNRNVRWTTRKKVVLTYGPRHR